MVHQYVVSGTGTTWAVTPERAADRVEAEPGQSDAQREQRTPHHVAGRPAAVQAEPAQRSGLVAVQAQQVQRQGDGNQREPDADQLQREVEPLAVALGAVERRGGVAQRSAGQLGDAG